MMAIEAIAATVMTAVGTWWLRGADVAPLPDPSTAAALLNVTAGARRIGTESKPRPDFPSTI
jgi:hypothetical protein